MSFDDLYNNALIIEQEVKGTASSSSSSWNMAFVSSPSSTNKVNTACVVSTDNIQVSIASTQVSTASTQVSTANLNDEVPTNMALMVFSDSGFNKSEFNLATYKRWLASVEEQLVFYKKNELEKLKQEKESNQLKIKKIDNASKSLDKLIRSQITDKSRKGVGFVSYNVVPPPPTGLFSPSNLDLSNYGLEEFQQPEFEAYGPKTSKSVNEDTCNEVRKSPDAPLVEELVSNDKLEKKTIFPTVAKINSARPQQQEKPVRKPVKYAEMYSFDHLQANCNYHQRERVVYGNNYTRVNYNYSAQKAHPSAQRNMAPRTVLMKTGPRPLNTARPVNIAHPKTTVYSARTMSPFSKSAQSTVKMPYQMRTTLTNKNFSQKVNTAKGKFYTARPNIAVVNAVRANQVNAVKASACWAKCPISETLKNLMDDMLPLGEEQNDEELLHTKDVCIGMDMLHNTSTTASLLILNQSLSHHYFNPKRLKDLGKPKRATKRSQSSGHIPLVANETIIKEWEDRMERAATTASSLEAEQDSGNINRTQSMATLNESFPQGTGLGSGPRVNTLGSGEDSMKLKELMELCTKLPERAHDSG
ncbi:hypothetical protein Tco_0978212 [Tanacetum coccineum]|uniref:Uncharacterized protein n=1 Tax=Tanacetum coccineum TaxID=301880 RepID=A0ABQ5EME9_9ASTR